MWLLFNHLVSTQRWCWCFCTGLLFSRHLPRGGAVLGLYLNVVRSARDGFLQSRFFIESHVPCFNGIVWVEEGYFGGDAGVISPLYNGVIVYSTRMNFTQGI